MEERIVTCTRKTKETNISLTLNLDGVGKTDIHTGIGFFDHMLDGFARHGLFDLEVSVNGDLDVDCHHTLSLIHIYKTLYSIYDKRKQNRQYRIGSGVLSAAIFQCLCRNEIICA